jgi:tetratricopeptide (TPR) repeat protein
MAPQTPRWRQVSDRHAAAGDFAAAFAARPKAGEAAIARIRSLLGGRSFEAAIGELDRLLAADPDDALALTMKAAALMDLGRYAEAEADSRQIAARFAGETYAQLVHANALRTLGETEAAIEAWRRSVALDPGCAEAWLALADLKTFRFAPEDVAAMGAAVAKADLPDEMRAKLCFALGKAFDDAGDAAGAFAAWTRGNAIEAARRGYRPDETTAFVRRSKAVLTPAFFAARAGWGAKDGAPIFIVGLPRSGSTLVEQILASHPDVEATHELPDLPMIAATVSGYPEGLARLNRETCARLGAEYLRRTAAYRQLGRPRFIDKTPKNFLHAGFIRLTLPNARIVDVRRHPLDCGVSIFRQYFGTGFNAAFSLEHIGRWYADYVDLMAHLDAAQPGAVTRVIYEDLVADTEGEVRRLLAALGLSFDPGCLRFFETRRPIDTPSAEQVRQPISPSAIGQWRRFEPWLEPLKAALGPALNGWRG